MEWTICHLPLCFLKNKNKLDDMSSDFVNYGGWKTGLKGIFFIQKPIFQIIFLIQNTWKHPRHLNKSINDPKKLSQNSKWTWNQKPSHALISFLGLCLDSIHYSGWKIRVEGLLFKNIFSTHFLYPKHLENTLSTLIN